ncbi:MULTISPECIES: PLD nuclease N-terminal domain-containing protein [unclassified Streptomyces]|uniref:PLD nuclease N-terminal domain-containing protein n=1 Tax=Streptomyces sp. NPDC006544 TaxID=3154583 RepID=UPI0033BA14E9|nr:PLD nuclease N-terminal domain-containing protein [Streptomyces sp. NBC_00974]
MNPQLAHEMTLAATSERAISVAAVGVLAVVAIAYVAFFVAAVVSIARSGLAGGLKLGWVVFAVVAPFLGSLLWFLVGRRDAQRQHQSGVA